MLLKSVVVLGVIVTLAAAYPAADSDDSGNDEDHKGVSLCRRRKRNCNEKHAFKLARAALYSARGDIRGPRERNAITDDRLKWTDRLVPYEIDDTVDANLRQLILDGMAKITSRTSSCIRFEPRSDQENYVVFYKPATSNCNSVIGMIGGSQTINLGPGCEYLGTVIHEILHAIGFNHEHNRSDRDDYLGLDLDNVEPDLRFAFDRVPDDRLFNGFDYYSIMIYGEYSFAIDTNKKTLWDKTGKNTIKDPFTKDDLTDSDVFRINSLYQCQ